jgi:hypothetical protein
LSRHKYPLVRVRSALAEQLVDVPSELPATVNAFIELGLAYDSCELTHTQRTKLLGYAKAAKLASINEVIALLIEKGLPALWWDLELKKGKA